MIGTGMKTSCSCRSRAEGLVGSAEGLQCVPRGQAQVAPKGEEPHAQRVRRAPARHWDPRQLIPTPTGPGGEAGQAGAPAKAEGAGRGEVGIGALDSEAKPWRPLCLYIHQPFTSS